MFTARRVKWAKSVNCVADGCVLRTRVKVAKRRRSVHMVWRMRAVYGAGSTGGLGSDGREEAAWRYCSERVCRRGGGGNSGAVPVQTATLFAKLR